MEELAPIAMYFVTGTIIQLLCWKWPLKSYGIQPVARVDVFFLFLAFGFGAIYQQSAVGLVYLTLDQIPQYVNPIRDYFAQSSWVLRLAAYAIIADFLSYWMHRLLHFGPFWQVHAFHHSAKSLNWYSGMRGSLLHVFGVLMPYSFVGVLTFAMRDEHIFYALLITDPLVQNLIHSGLRLPFERQLSWVFVTPSVHFVHHHPNPRFTNTNYSFIFSLWDRAFGTYTDPESIPASERGQLGLDYEIGTLSLILGFELTERVYPPGRAPEHLKKSA